MTGLDFAVLLIIAFFSGFFAMLFLEFRKDRAEDCPSCKELTRQRDYFHFNAGFWHEQCRLTEEKLTKIQQMIEEGETWKLDQYNLERD